MAILKACVKIKKGTYPDRISFNKPSPKAEPNVILSARLYTIFTVETDSNRFPGAGLIGDTRPAAQHMRSRLSSLCIREKIPQRLMMLF